MSTDAILYNSPALHALKRAQLVQLCKVHSIKASGKNTDIIDRLKSHAATLSTMNQNQDASEENPDLVGDSDTVMPEATRSLPSETWEIVMDSIAEVDESSGTGTITSKSTRSSKATLPSTKSSSSSVFLTGSGEFGTAKSKGSSSTVGSSIKSFASTLGLKRGNSAASTSSSTSRLPVPSEAKQAKGRNPDELAAHSKPYAQLPQSSPSSLPQTDHFTVDPSSLFNPVTLTVDSNPIPGHLLRQGLPAPDNARLSLGIGPATPSRAKGPTTTLRLVSNPKSSTESTQHTGRVSETPRLKPFATSFDLLPGSPATSQCKSESAKDVSPRPELDGELHKAQAERTPVKARAEPFIFGSPLPQHRVSDLEFKDAAKAVLDEMNKRLESQGVDGVDAQVLNRLRPGGHVVSLQNGNVSDNLPEKSIKTTDITRKFDKAHEKQFSKMQSIGNRGQGHVVLGTKRKSSAVDDATQSRDGSVLGPRKQEIDGESCPREKRPRVSYVPVENNMDDEEQKRRAAVKRKLEMNKARRRSSGSGPRASIGKGVLSKPKPKPARFGFLSSAKSMVSNVWSRGKTSSADPQPAHTRVTQMTVPIGPTKAPASSHSSSLPVVPKDESVRTKSQLPFRQRIPTGGRKSSVSKGVPPANRRRSVTPGAASSTGTGPLVPKQGLVGTQARVSSLGQRSILSSADNTTDRVGKRKASDPTRLSASSRLLAPTASSLAKQSMGRRSSVLAPITNANEDQIAEMSDAVKPAAQPGLVVRQRTLTNRRPRISRGKVIAKLASQRAVAAGVGLSPKPGGKTRSSLGVKVQRAEMGSKTRTSAGTPNRVADARKRARQSEYFARRRSSRAVQPLNS